ncbi:MAG: hypothetical protein RJR34_00070 [Candidatus Methanoculleus thermohydrogenotrophicum]|nr:hypothetical protein [Candidatus Methanoculleus thermohydrogenotrophicum]
MQRSHSGSVRESARIPAAIDKTAFKRRVTRIWILYGTVARKGRQHPGTAASEEHRPRNMGGV